MEEKLLILGNTPDTMLRLAKLFCFVLLSNCGFAQTDWTWTELAPMPFPTANNAVCEATVGQEKFVYSFGGIDPTKLYSGIHQRAAKYSVALDNWIEIDPLPDTLGKIASGASFVKGKIYIIGGYHVFANHNEISSNKVHVYNPSTDMYEADAASTPFPIDDHVQCVYNDSLIFVVTGWSNTSNKPYVQIFNPELNQWQTGTYTPNTSYFKSFGASRHIIGDTLYYYGGAGGSGFAARPFMRKGYINPSDPTDITWTLMDDAPGLPSYRAACSGVGNTVFWVGGSSVSYNYDGVAYNGSGGVDPSARILSFNNDSYQFIDDNNQPFGVMDLRGIAKLDGDNWIICGGMDSTQTVNNRTFLLNHGSLGNELESNPFTVKYSIETVIIESIITEEARIVDAKGEEVMTFDSTNKFELKGSNWASGIYTFVQGNYSIRIRL